MEESEALGDESEDLDEDGSEDPDENGSEDPDENGSEDPDENGSVSLYKNGNEKDKNEVALYDDVSEAAASDGCCKLMSREMVVVENHSERNCVRVEQPSCLEKNGRNPTRDNPVKLYKYNIIR